jgi:uncharacterized membrane protein YhaH (DUF805 family)
LRVVAAIAGFLTNSLYVCEELRGDRLMLTQIVFALFTPNQRLPVLPFVILKIIVALVALMSVAVYRSMCECSDNQWLLIGLYLLLIWMGCCLVANRFHDGGMSAIWLAAIYGLIAFAFLVKLDPTLLGDDIDTQEAWEQRLYIVRCMSGMLGCAILVWSLKTQSEKGPNQYGLPFGETESEWTTLPTFKDKKTGKKVQAKPQSLAAERLQRVSRSRDAAL